MARDRRDAPHRPVSPSARQMNRSRSSDATWQLPDTPFGRLAFAHATAVAGDTLVTMALAGSLFFSITPDAAKGKVTLYLMLTLAPFVVLSPFIGPLIDRFSGGRRLIVIATAIARCLVCMLMAGDLDGLLLFPEAFAVLVLSKTYTVARSALVPAVVTSDRELVRANSRLSLISGLAGFVIVPVGGIVLKITGGAGVLWVAALVFVGAALAAVRIELVRRVASPSLESRAAPATSSTPPGGVGARELPVGARAGASPSGGKGRAGRMPRVRRGLAAARLRERSEALALRLAVMAMATLRAQVGFLTFLLAFAFRRAKAPTWWFGLALAASGVGAVIGALIAPRLRVAIKEERMIVGALGFVSLAGLAAAFDPNRGASAVVALVVSLAAATARLAFDSLAQSSLSHDEHGARFARFETTFQLVWVLGALVPVVVSIPRRAGFIIMSAAAAAVIAVYVIGEPALERVAKTRQRIVQRRPSDPLDPFEEP